MLRKTYSLVKVGLCNSKRCWSVIFSSPIRLYKCPHTLGHGKVNLRGDDLEDPVILIILIRREEQHGHVNWRKQNGTGVRWPGWSPGLVVLLYGLKKVKSTNIYCVYILHQVCRFRSWAKFWSAVMGSQNRENHGQFPTFSLSIDRETSSNFCCCKHQTR